jgi:Holliday junction resolvase
MALTPEKKVKDKVKKVLVDAGAYYFMPGTHGYGASGVPDIVGCYQSKFFGIECKAGDNKPTALQLRNLSQITTAGGYTLVVNEDNLNDVSNMLKEIQNGTRRRDSSI